MKRILRFPLVLMATWGAYYVFESVAELIGVRAIFDDTAIGFLIVNSAILFAAAVFFIYTYVLWYVATSEYKRAFLNRTLDGYDMKTEFVLHMKTMGKFDIIVYMLYSVPMLLVAIFWKVRSPVQFLYFQQVFFYTIVSVPVISYILNILLFVGGYTIGVVLLHKRWHKNRERYNKPKHNPES